ncbi:MAG: cytidylate kinase-like family protein [Deltaproteobacteria bacterium]|nr:cytidylate kinase-like family protein [Deltaproteobacteria bacterium]MBW2017294.1 cytidylate kinase-like family protein [Deltaproteobacteria bacterium]MBW2129742.1 cytidylate kinase-like family protein [Deltaproteobacteria bacterium]MBW2304345.1 cytidylate kinase-like family protein [Deltaproteobacteria bacterium]
MSVIIVSSDSYRKGREVAEKTAEALGYEYLDRELLKAVAASHDLPEDRLEKALRESPSLFGISSKNHARYLAYIEAAVLSELSRDRVVCHGLAAHLYVLGVSHVLKIRILADPEEWVKLTASEKGVPPEKAARLNKREEALQKRWSLGVYGIDETDPSLYDMVISLSQIDADEAVKTIVETVSYRRFKPMTYSIKCMKDRELASRVRSALLERFTDVKVRADGTTVVVETKALKREKRKKAEAIKELAGGIPGVDYVEVHVINDIFRQAAESFR